MEQATWLEKLKDSCGRKLLSFAGQGLEFTKMLLKTWPDAFKEKDEVKDMSQHHILFCTISEWEMIKILMEAQPNAVKEKNNNGGNLPLHCGLSNWASVEVIEILFQTWPGTVKEKGEDGNEPPHFGLMCEASLEVTKMIILDSLLNTGKERNEGGHACASTCWFDMWSFSGRNKNAIGFIASCVQMERFR